MFYNLIWGGGSLPHLYVHLQKHSMIQQGKGRNIASRIFVVNLAGR